jgi:threonine/homoserine efflux transporter RhtA
MQVGIWIRYLMIFGNLIWKLCNSDKLSQKLLTLILGVAIVVLFTNNICLSLEVSALSRIRKMIYCVILSIIRNGLHSGVTKLVSI